MIEKLLIKMIEHEKFKKVFQFLQKHGKLVKEEKNQKIFKDDAKSNIIAYLCIVTVTEYIFKNIIFTVVQYSLDNSLNILYDTVE